MQYKAQYLPWNWYPFPSQNHLEADNHSTMILLNSVHEATRRIQRIMLVILLLQFHNNIRTCQYLLRPAIVDPHASPWRKLYENADATSFLHMTSLTRESFWALLEYVFDLEEITQRHRGCPCSMGPDGYLGLLLFYLGSTMYNKHLCLIFGLTLSVCGRVINWMQIRTVRLLHGNPFAQVKFPNNAKSTSKRTACC